MTLSSCHCTVAVVLVPLRDTVGLKPMRTKRGKSSIKTVTSTTAAHPGGMEMESAEQLWSRSFKYGFRYTTLLSDGDVKTHNHLDAASRFMETLQSRRRSVSITRRSELGRHSWWSWLRQFDTFRDHQAHGLLQEGQFGIYLNWEGIGKPMMRHSDQCAS